MVKAEWGTKRTCRDCGARFYDLRRNPIMCPKCETVHEPEPPPKPRVRRVPAAEKAREIAKKTPDDATPPAKETKAASEDKKDEDKKDKGGDIIEDPSELGEDEDDIAEVLEVVEEKKGEKESS